MPKEDYDGEDIERLVEQGERFMTNMIADDRAELFTPTQHERFLIRAGDEGLLDRPMGEVNVSKIPDYSIDAIFQEGGEFAGVNKLRYFVYQDQFVKIDESSTLAALGYKQTDNDSAKIREALVREVSVDNISNFPLLTDWATEYETNGAKEGCVFIQGEGYHFILPDPKRLAEIAAEEKAKKTEHDSAFGDAPN